LRVGAWNAQHCHFPRQGGALLAAHGLDVVLLSELDIGMRRSGQRNTPRLLADAQGHGHAFGLEFLELVASKGLSSVGDGVAENLAGFHGNGLTAGMAPNDFRLIHLPSEADWYAVPRRGQYRIGGRMALAVRFPLGPSD